MCKSMRSELSMSTLHDQVRTQPKIYAPLIGHVGVLLLEISQFCPLQITQVTRRDVERSRICKCIMECLFIYLFMLRN